MEKTDDKLLQIVLVGQPELDETLDSPQLRQLKQRIALRAALGPLEYSEVEEYITRRLQIAGAAEQRDSIFTADAIAVVNRYSQGLPRLINTICENSLITAYARKSQIVTPGIVDEVARQFRLDLDMISHEQQRPAGRGKKEVRQAAGTVRDLFVNLMRSSASGADEKVLLTEETGEHEPGI
jgi:general secretion pathway protein A